MDNILKTFIVILGTISLIFGLSVLLAFPVMWLWNWLAVDLFHLPMITLWQAFGLRLLIQLLWPSNWSKSSNNN